MALGRVQRGEDEDEDGDEDEDDDEAEDDQEQQEDALPAPCVLLVPARRWGGDVSPARQSELASGGL